ncbi:MAG: DUF1611 domain-containing protein [Egibacteraceae bacterium]
MSLLAVDAHRLQRAKRAFTTRHVRPEAMARLLTSATSPRPGDFVLARVGHVSKHRRIELPNGRRATLFPDDEIVVCYGHRYAPDQFEAEVPSDLGECHLVAGGGVAARMRSKHASCAPPTTIVPVGLVATADGKRVNLRDWALPAATHAGSFPPIVAVLGTAMNSGKTDTAVHLIRGLVRAGYAVGAAKVTGTGSGQDLWLMADAGASPALDFTTAGHASTYLLDPGEVIRVFQTLTSHLAAQPVDAIVLEVADGVFQAETAALISSAAFAERVGGVVFAASDALGAVAGVTRLKSLGLPVIAAGGCLTRSPLAIREAEQALDLPVLGRAALSEPALAAQLVPVPSRTHDGVSAA